MQSQTGLNYAKVHPVLRRAKNLEKPFLKVWHYMPLSCYRQESDPLLLATIYEQYLLSKLDNGKSPLW